jgi:hypothetical protein
LVFSIDAACRQQSLLDWRTPFLRLGSDSWRKALGWVGTVHDIGKVVVFSEAARYMLSVGPETIWKSPFLPKCPPKSNSGPRKR